MVQPVNIGNRDPQAFEQVNQGPPGEKKELSFAEATKWAEHLIEAIKKDEHNTKEIFDLSISGLKDLLIPAITKFACKFFPAAQIPANGINMVAEYFLTNVQKKVTQKKLDDCSEKIEDLIDTSMKGSQKVSNFFDEKIASLKK